MRLGLAIASLALLAGCGYVGPPLPPALYVPQPVKDLRAEQVGDKIFVHFTLPALTTEDLPATDLRAVTLYAGVGEPVFSIDRYSATAERFQIDVTKSEHTLPATAWTGKDLILYVRTTGRTGRESDWSVPLMFAVGTPLTPPANLDVKNAPEAVSLKWTGNAPRYRVLRSTDGKLEPLVEVESPEYMDGSTEYGTRYTYVIVGLGGKDQQSLPSSPADITPQDAFPPAIPGSPTAVAGAKSVDLSWTRSADAAGYNVYRAVGDGPFEPLEKLVLLPAYTDTRVESGKRYRYTISAVDTAGNESNRSAEAAAQVE